jgi:hypothetical protein
VVRGQGGQRRQHIVVLKVQSFQPDALLRTF